MQGFSSSLYNFFHDEKGDPLGRENVITDVTYTDWQTVDAFLNKLLNTFCHILYVTYCIAGIFCVSGR